MQIQLRYQMPSDIDPVSLSWQHGHAVCGRHDIPSSKIDKCYSIDQLIDWANQDLELYGVESWHSNVTYTLAQFVKINLLYHDLRADGNRKPLLIRPQGTGWYPLTGDSRLRAFELLDPAITVFCIAVCDGVDADAEHLPDFDSFARACSARPGQRFWMRLGDQGLEWYETGVDTRYPVTGPNFNTWAADIVKHYVNGQGSGFRFDRDWFCQRHSWLEEIGR